MEIRPVRRDLATHSEHAWTSPYFPNWTARRPPVCGWYVHMLVLVSVSRLHHRTFNSATVCASVSSYVIYQRKAECLVVSGNLYRHIRSDYPTDKEGSSTNFDGYYIQGFRIIIRISVGLLLFSYCELPIAIRCVQLHLYQYDTIKYISRNGGASLSVKLRLGGRNDENSTLHSVERYNPSTNAWSWMAKTSTPRSHVALAALGGRLYAAGGLENDAISCRVERYTAAVRTLVCWRRPLKIIKHSRRHNEFKNLEITREVCITMALQNCAKSTPLNLFHVNLMVMHTL